MCSMDVIVSLWYMCALKCVFMHGIHLVCAWKTVVCMYMECGWK